MDTTPLAHARSILDSMLGYLGFTVKIEESDGPEGPTLQILTEDGDRLIGRNGETLEDIQYLEYYRSMREDNLVEKAKQLADRVRATGQPMELPPLNSYYRRIVHNLFANDPQVMSVSEQGQFRFKRMFLKKRVPK
jgi:spoIIIJ-associated protein